VDARPETTTKSTRDRAWVAWLAGAVAALATWCAMGRVERGERRTRVEATVAGARVTSDASKLRARVLEQLRKPLVLEIGADTRTTTAEALGARVDDERLEAMVRDLDDGKSALVRSATTSTLALPLAIRFDAKAAFAAIVALKEDFDRPAEDAKLDLDARKVLSESPGLRIDVYATLAALEDALKHGENRVKVTWVAVAPQLTKEKLAGVELTDTLGFFETKYATDRKHVDRTFNLRLAASRLNGKVILPGETFDFNQVVGPRDEAHGYRVAKVIADGELVDGMGGGTCQIAGTLHGAALFAGLDIVQRSPHTRPSYYIKMGLDAAVAYPAIDLKIRNPFPFPVVLKETVVGGMVHAEILGPRRTRVVTFVRKIEEVIPFPEREVGDDRLPEGKRVLVQRGIPGFKVRRYRIVRDGPNAVREKTDDTYPPTTQIWHVGTGEGATKKPSPAASGSSIAGREIAESHGASSHLTTDDHPEYVADAYLAITQGPGIGKSAGKDDDDVLRHLNADAFGAAGGPAPSGMEEVRVAGETGTKGWTKKYIATSSSTSPHPIDDSVVEEEPTESCEGDECKPVAKHAPAHKRRKK
jgi:vancomycin resistance protein YoaR